MRILPSHCDCYTAEKREFSILLIAGGAAVAAALGGLLLDDGVEDVEKAVQTGSIPGIDLAAAPVDENTKLALKVAVALLGLVGVAVGKLALLQCTIGRAYHIMAYIWAQECALQSLPGCYLLGLDCILYTLQM